MLKATRTYTVGLAFAFAAGSTPAGDSQELKAGASLQTTEAFDVQPKVIQLTKPVYPREAYDAGVEGTVELELLIDSQGRPVRAKVTKSIPELNKAAMECVVKWRFSPAEKSGQPVSATAKVLVVFRREAPQDRTEG